MAEPPSAQAIVEQLKQASIEFVVNVPDRVTSRLTDLIARDAFFKFIPVRKEDEGISICSALSFGDRRAVLIMQHTGLLDSVNSLRSVVSEFGHPVVMIVGLLNKEPGLKPTESARVGVRISEPLLDLLGVKHALVESAGDEAQIAGLIEDAYSRPESVALLVGARLV